MCILCKGLQTITAQHHRNGTVTKVLPVYLRIKFCRAELFKKQGYIDDEALQRVNCRRRISTKDGLLEVRSHLKSCRLYTEPTLENWLWHLTAHWQQPLPTFLMPIQHVKLATNKAAEVCQNQLSFSCHSNSDHRQTLTNRPTLSDRHSTTGSGCTLVFQKYSLMPIWPTD